MVSRPVVVSVVVATSALVVVTSALGMVSILEVVSAVVVASILVVVSAVVVDSILVVLSRSVVVSTLVVVSALVSVLSVIPALVAVSILLVVSTLVAVSAPVVVSLSSEEVVGSVDVVVSKEDESTDSVEEGSALADSELSETGPVVVGSVEVVPSVIGEESVDKVSSEADAGNGSIDVEGGRDEMVDNSDSAMSIEAGMLDVSTSLMESFMLVAIEETLASSSPFRHCSTIRTCQVLTSDTREQGNISV